MTATMLEGCMECRGLINEYYSAGCDICNDLKVCVNVCLETNKERWDNEKEQGA